MAILRIEAKDTQAIYGIRRKAEDFLIFAKATIVKIRKTKSITITPTATSIFFSPKKTIDQRLLRTS